MDTINPATLRLLAQIFSDPKTLSAIASGLASLADLLDNARQRHPRRVNTPEELEELIWYSVHVYEDEYLSAKHGHRQVAGRTRQTLRKHRTAREGLIELITNRHSSTGLSAMAEIGRLDLSFEQIIIDNDQWFPPDLVIKSRNNLEALRSAA